MSEVSRVHLTRLWFRVYSDHRGKFMFLNTAKLSSILLLTLNFWAGCCCINSGCDSEMTGCSTNAVVTEQSCHSENKSAKLSASHNSIKDSLITKTCQCGNHQVGKTSALTLPIQHEISFTTPMIVQRWSKYIDSRREIWSIKVLSASAISDRHAPRLSVLARFLI